MKLRINGRVQTLDVPPEMPLLWALRDVVGLTGTKFGCGAGLFVNPDIVKAQIEGGVIFGISGALYRQANPEAAAEA